MGFFDFLFGGKSIVETLNDRIWLTDAARWRGIQDELHDRAAVCSGVLLVAQFPDTRDALLPLRNEVDGHCEVRLASELSSDLASYWPVDESRPAFVLVAERHPLRSKDKHVVEFAGELPGKAQVAFHLSLEDALLKAFLGPQIEQLLRQLGMDENESIDSRMVSRRIAAAQKKIAATTFGDSDARSAEEWLAANVPDMSQ